MQCTTKLTVILLLLAAMLSLAGCAGPSAAGTGDSPAADDGAASDGSEFHAQLLQIAREYTSYPLVDPNMNWAPAMCAAPPGPPAPTYSSSDQADSHGSKLYFLFAGDAVEYVLAKTKPSPAGQTVVKESWRAEPVETPDANIYAEHASGQQVAKYTSHGDKTYQAGEQRELFIMFKTDPHTAGTDNGWVYGVVSPDAKNVIAAGRLNNCMTCHQEAGVDRLFGPKYPPESIAVPR